MFLIAGYKGTCPPGSDSSSGGNTTATFPSLDGGGAAGNLQSLNGGGTGAAGDDQTQQQQQQMYHTPPQQHYADEHEYQALEAAHQQQYLDGSSPEFYSSHLLEQKYNPVHGYVKNYVRGESSDKINFCNRGFRRYCNKYHVFRPHFGFTQKGRQHRTLVRCSKRHRIA